ncbi:hypothetical protein [Allokutzneria sp. NRRL B-24872]|uniref:hypothetical protein n=1 Tax=Allokutzneria sp. NRRL B-24872 TaxID=1137961 RepID=UPI00117773D0|nr:hypothetical protein [Allokutzneria sp. NRRL B-24872]
MTTTRGRLRGCVPIEVIGQIDLDTSTVLERTLELARMEARAAAAMTIVVDPGEVSRLSAAGIGLLVRAHARRLPHALMLCVGTRHLRAVFPLQVNGVAEFFALSTGTAGAVDTRHAAFVPGQRRTR